VSAARSWLFVPGDSARKVERSLASDAEALIFDWEDAVAPVAKGAAREGRPRSGLADLERLGLALTTAQAAAGCRSRDLGVVAIVTETAASVLAIGEFRRPVPRLAGMMWGAEDLAGPATATPRARIARRFAWRAARCCWQLPPRSASTRTRLDPSTWPSRRPDERAWAERVLAALADRSLAAVDGRMVDAPHLRVARRILSRASGVPRC
jgi:citrate lyase subunit beta/citryl-CoA lyase